LSWLSEKMKRWEESIDRNSAPGKGHGVVAGWDSLTNDGARLAEWSEGAQERLAAAVPDEAARRRTMVERCCTFVEEFGDEDIRKLRDIYRETGSVEQVLKSMRENGSRFGDPFLEGDAIVEIRRPRDPEAFAKARDARERQVAACFCPLIRETARRIPKDYCYCSAGWYKGIYEGIFGEPVEVTVEESLISGDERCRFSIRIPGVIRK
jgi:hypothetical protein